MNGITPPSWYTDLQIQSIERFFASIGTLDGRRIFDIGAGALAAPLIFANMGAEVFCYEPTSAFDDYLKEVHDRYQSQPWWQRMNTFACGYEEFCDSACINEKDIVVTNMPTAPFPVEPGELDEVKKKFGKRIRPAPFSDGGYYGFELMNDFIKRVSRTMAPGSHIVVQIPEYSSLAGQDVRHFTGALFGESGIELLEVYSLESIIFPDSIVGTRLQLYAERLGWIPARTEKGPVQITYSFIGNKQSTSQIA